jgi:hypothetical protein
MAGTVNELTVLMEDQTPKKHSVRFDARDEDAAMSSAYVTKKALAELGNPPKVEIVIRAVW